MIFFSRIIHKNRNSLKLDDFRLEIQRRDQEIMSMAAKMKTLEEQHQVSQDMAYHSNQLISFSQLKLLKDYQRHISVLKESLCAKEEHYNMLQSDVRFNAFFRKISLKLFLPIRLKNYETDWKRKIV